MSRRMGTNFAEVGVTVIDPAMINQLPAVGEYRAFGGDLHPSLAGQLMFWVAQAGAMVRKLLHVVADHVSGRVRIAIDKGKIDSLRAKLVAIATHFRRVTVGNRAFCIDEKKHF